MTIRLPSRCSERVNTVQIAHQRHAGQEVALLLAQRKEWIKAAKAANGDN